MQYSLHIDCALRDGPSENNSKCILDAVIMFHRIHLIVYRVCGQIKCIPHWTMRPVPWWIRRMPNRTRLEPGKGPHWFRLTWCSAQKASVALTQLQMYWQFYRAHFLCLTAVDDAVVGEGLAKGEYIEKCFHSLAISSISVSSPFVRMIRWAFFSLLTHSLVDAHSCIISHQTHIHAR